MPATSPRAKSAPTPATAQALPPFLTFPLIKVDYLRDVFGDARLREALAHPSAPRPVLGGTKGALAVYSRDAVIEFFERVARDGWPVAQGGAS